MSTATMDRAAWLAERMTGIGASEAAAVCGVSEYETPLDVYLRKIGVAPEKVETPRMRWGTRLEGVIADAYAERVGVGLADTQRFVRSSVHPFMLATLDAVRQDGRIVEFKTMGERAADALGDQLGDDGSDVIPLHWRCQVTHQQIVAGTDVADLAVLIGGSDFRVYTIGYDERVAARMLAIEAEFWGRVERREPPAIDPARDGRNLALLYPEPAGALPLPLDTEAEVVEWLRLKEHIGALSKAADHLKASIVAALGPFAEGQLSDGRVLVRKVIKREGYTVEPCSYVDVRVKKGGK